jgi:ubiquinone/menaquinone biosynthesis C-methylase UbiE
VSEETIRATFAARRDPPVSQLGAGDRYILQRRDDALAELLAQNSVSLHQARILEVGCGDGRVLQSLVRLGAREENLAGVDLLAERIGVASEVLPRADLRTGSASHLDWPDQSFDLVAQFTMISSVTDQSSRRACLDEMERVLKPDGAILWYDFLWNPLNRATRGLTMGEVRRLFPRAAIDFRRVTLLPPLARLLAPVSPALCRTLEAVTLLRTHYLALIRPEP